MSRRIVITGIGVVSPVGNNAEDFWSNLIGGVSGIGRITKFDTADYKVKIAGEVRNFDITEYVDAKDAKRMDSFSQYAVAAAQQAIEDSGLRDYDKERVGCVIGTGIGGLGTLEEQHRRLLERGPGRVSPLTVPMLMPNAAAGLVSIVKGFSGVNYGTVSACASGAHAMIDAYKMIQMEEADMVVAGGAEAVITGLGIAAFANMGALTKSYNDSPQKASRPFERDRDGFVIAEGAGISILEEMEHAEKRGAKIYAEIAGYGMTADAHHITAPDKEGIGAARAMRMALQKAEIELVDYINAHGTSTELNDKIETAAIKGVFGKDAYRIPISSTKSMTGHLLGGAGGIEAIVCVKAIDSGIIPPTINLENPDPECDLDYVPNKARHIDVKAVMSNSFGFGGHNAVLIFKRYG